MKKYEKEIYSKEYLPAIKQAIDLALRIKENNGGNMGEIADMMLDGTLCEGCGCYLDGEPEGFPRYCENCRPAGKGRKKDRKKRSLY